MEVTRNFLKGMGLTEEQVSAIIEEHVSTTNALKEQRDSNKDAAEQLNDTPFLPHPSSVLYQRNAYYSQYLSYFSLISFAKEGYVDGTCVTQIDNLPMSLIDLYNPSITLKGLEYLEENSLMKKAAKLAKGIAEVIP